MSQNKLTIQLTGDQQKQIREATGKSVTELSVNLSPAVSGLSDAELDKASGGGIPGESLDDQFKNKIEVL